MKLKTYRARTMAEALAAVKKDFGRGAVILHTRMTRSGGFLGFGRRSFVELTASDEAPARGLTASGISPAAVSSRTPPARAAHASPAAPRQPRPATADVEASGASRVAAPASAAVAAYAASSASTFTDRGSPAASTSSEPRPVSDSQSPRHAGSDPVVMSVRSRGGSASSSSDPATSNGPVAERTAPVSISRQDPELIRRELADIKLLVNQVLQCTPPALASDPARIASPALGGWAAGDWAAGKGGALLDIYLRLLEAQVSRAIADRVIGEVRDELTSAELTDPGIVRATVLRHLSGLIPVADDTAATHGDGARRAGGPLVIALIGPTGVGKTTTIAKLAATYRLRRGRSVGLITADTYRIAAVDQLRTYASIIGLPMKVVMTPAEMAAAVDAFGSHDVVLIDTAGRSQRNTERLVELAGHIEAARPTETHLVLSSAASQEVLLDAAEAFAPLKPNRVILTKLDEAVHFGALINVMQQLRTRLSFVTTGQEVPDHIEPGQPDRLARLVLGEELGEQRDVTVSDPMVVHPGCDPRRSGAPV